MAIGNTLLYRQDFTGTTVTVTHNLDLRDVGYRVVCSGQSRSDLVQNMNLTEGDERNSFVINFESYNEGHVQVLGGDIYPTNLPSPENNVKLNGLPQASGITDSYVTGATLNSTTLELGRNQGLSNVTADLSSIDGTVTRVDGGGTVNGLTLTGSITENGGLTLGGTLAINNGDWSGTDLSIANGGTGVSTSQDAINELTQVGSATNEYVLTKDTSTGNALWKAGGGGEDTFVSGGTFNTTTDNIDFVGNSSDTTFSVDMGIIQHDRQVADIPTWSPSGPSSYTDIPGASATTGNLGANGDYIIIFNANWQVTTKNKQADFQILVGGSVQTISERGHSNAKQNEDYTISSSIMVSDIASGTIIKVQGKVNSNNLSIQRGTLIIDGIRTTNNIS